MRAGKGVPFLRIRNHQIGGLTSSGRGFVRSDRRHSCPKPLGFAIPDRGVVPEGRPRIARRFNAGFATDNGRVPKGRLSRGVFQPSLRDSMTSCDAHPTLKRWAIVKSPFGTRRSAIRPPICTGQILATLEILVRNNVRISTTHKILTRRSWLHWCGLKTALRARTPALSFAIFYPV